MDFNLNTKSMLYIEIANEYKKYIQLGILKYNEKLPSVRNLALDLGINPNTVSRAYQLLEEEGYIKTYLKKGAYVSYMSDNEAEKIKTCENQVLMFKKIGIKKETLEDIIAQVYGSDLND